MSMKEQIQPPKGAPLFNPWSPEFIANPYPSYHLLRETEPMHYMPLGLYLASRHADITTILRDKRFGKGFTGRVARRAGPQILEEPVYRTMSRWMLQLDPPDHGRLRSLVVRAFSARRIEDMRPRIQDIVDAIIDRVEPRGHMDLIADFAHRLPVTVICDMLGIPEEHREFFHANSGTGGRLLDLAPLSHTEIQQQNAFILRMADYF
jgi:cytochrome P450